MPINLCESEYRTEYFYVYKGDENIRNRLTPIVSARDTDRQNVYLSDKCVHKAIGLQIFTETSMQCVHYPAVGVRFTRVNTNKNV